MMTTSLRTYWNTLATRERTLVLAAALTIGVALAWQLLLAPALKTLRQAPARHAALDSQWQRMQALQAQAQQLQQAPKSHQSETRKVLQSSLTQHFGNSAQLAISGQQATVTLTQAPAAALSHWLAHTRSITHAVPIQAQLTRSNPGTEAAAHWNGTLVLTLPAE